MVKKLGGGSVAEVFLVRSALTQQQQVMKVLRPELMSDASVVGRFLDEAKLCETLDHPHIVKHLGVSRTPSGGLYILTRYLDGIDLARHLKENGPLTAAEWVALGTKLCDALAYIHERGIVHRDLKPSNVFLAGGLAAQRPVLIDFGVARPEGPRRVKTELGVVLTTPEYAAPELVQGGTPDIRSDLYAFGVLMFESLVGHPPFVDPSANRIFQMHLEETPGPLPTGAAALEPVVQRCMAKRPEDRYPSARAIAEALNETVPYLAHARETLTPPQPQGGPEAPAPSRTDVAPGVVLGNYRIERLLGEGGMGQVFLATHEKLGRHVAMKILRPELATRHDTVERFFQEARSVNQINHEHIVEVHDFVDERSPDGAGRVYCIMELLAGKTLRDLIKGDPIPLRRNLGIARQVCDALAAAHRLNIVHRDVKPENIFLTERSGIQDFVKVLDFGMAKFQPQEKGVSKATLQGMIVGTPDYMAPEQANGLSTDVRTDIYSLGVVLYEMLTGQVPFTAPAIMPLLLKISNEAPPPLPAADRAGEPIPETLRALVMWCLEKVPAERPQSVGAVIEVLDQILSPRRSSALDVELKAIRPSRRKWIAVGGGLCAGIIAVIAIAASHKTTASVQEVPAPALPPIAVAPPPPTPASPIAEPAKPLAIKLELTSRPAGAVVRRLDSNEELGKTPLSMDAVPARSRNVALRFELPGYSAAEHTVRWDRDVNLDVTLAPDQARSVVPKPKPPSPTPRRPSKDDLVDPLSP
jgi:serine/threonine protein kinase